MVARTGTFVGPAYKSFPAGCPEIAPPAPEARAGGKSWPLTRYSQGARCFSASFSVKAYADSEARHLVLDQQFPTFQFSNLQIIRRRMVHRFREFILQRLVPPLQLRQMCCQKLVTLLHRRLRINHSLTPLTHQTHLLQLQLH